MKKMLIAMSFLVLSITVFGQAQESTIPQPYKDAVLTAAKIDLPYSPQVVIQVIRDYGLVSGKNSQQKAVGYLLNENTQLTQNNPNSADLHYYVQLKHLDNPNETVLYLNLRSSTLDKDNNEQAYYFNLQEALAYLDNLEKAIKQDATRLQVELQNDNLAKSKARSTFLIREAQDLNSRQQSMKFAFGGNQNAQRTERLTQKLQAINQKININRITQANQEAETLKQGLALALLMHPVKQQ